LYSPEDYDYELPEELIAQKPLTRRDQSRLLHLDRKTGRVAHRVFSDISDILSPGDVLVINDTKVIPGRLFGRKESGGKVEVLLLDYAQGVHDRHFACLIRASKRPRPGSRLLFENDLTAVVETVDERICYLTFHGTTPFEQTLESIGHVPLPPYIRRQDTPDDRHTYQTVYASRKGAIAAPTAGLHFTPDLLEVLQNKGVRLTRLTLHVGYGTFVPVQVDDIRDHRMHSEGFELSQTTARTIRRAKADGRRVVAVGTTCVRTLEYCARNEEIAAQDGYCDLFIYPGFTFNAVDAMITNFHLPKSTLMMLVSAFAGRRRILNAYHRAVEERYRFFSYGDAMIIL
jgi:S-adenosylmethionine:tRNA ribosyltransferase-isomerase